MTSQNRRATLWGAPGLRLSQELHPEGRRPFSGCLPSPLPPSSASSSPGAASPSPGGCPASTGPERTAGLRPGPRWGARPLCGPVSSDGGRARSLVRDSPRFRETAVVFLEARAFSGLRVPAPDPTDGRTRLTRAVTAAHPAVGGDCKPHRRLLLVGPPAGSTRVGAGPPAGSGGRTGFPRGSHTLSWPRLGGTGPGGWVWGSGT